MLAHRGQRSGWRGPDLLQTQDETGSSSVWIKTSVLVSHVLVLVLQMRRRAEPSECRTTARLPREVRGRPLAAASTPCC